MYGSAFRKKAIMIILSVLIVLMSLGLGGLASAEALAQPDSEGLENPGFELSAAGGAVPGWSMLLGAGQNGSFAVSGEQYRSGSSSLKLVDSANISFAIESRKVPVAAGQTYKADAFWYLQSGAAQLQLRFYDQAGTLISGAIAVDNPNFTSAPRNQWIPLSVQAAVPANGAYATVVLVTGKTSTGTIYVDDVQLSRSLPIQNNGFEAGADGSAVIPSWTQMFGVGKIGSVSLDTTTVKSGAASLRIDDQDTVNFGVESTKTPVVAGREQTVTSAVYIASGQVQLQLRYYDQAGKLTGTIAVNDPNYTSQPIGIWQTLSVKAVAPPAATQASVVLVSGKTTKGVSYWDDVLLMERLPDYVNQTDPGTGSVYPTLQNSGFELPLNGQDIPNWKRAFGTLPITLSADRYAEGSHSLVLADSSDADPLGVISDYIAATPGKVYSVIAMLSGDGSGNAELYLRFYDVNDTLLSNVNTVAANPPADWQTMTVKQAAPAGAVKAAVVLYSSKTNIGTYYFDQLSWSEELPPPPAQRYLVNGSFEQPLQRGAIPGWTVKSGLASISTSTAKDGSNSLFVQNVKTTGSGINMESGLIDVEENAEYRLSTQVDLEAGALEGLYVYVYDAQGALVKSPSGGDFQTYLNAIPGTTIPAGEWGYIEKLFTVPAGGKKLKVSLISGNRKDYRFYLDDVSVLKVLANGDMEKPAVNGVIPGWKKFAASDAPSFRLTNDLYANGTASLELTNTPGQYLNVVSDLIPVEPGATYTALSKTYIQAGSSGMYVRFFDDTGAYLGKQNWSILSEPTDAWFDQFVKFTVPAEATYAAVMYAGSNNKTYTFYADDVRILRGDHEVKEEPMPENSILKIGEDLGVQIRKATLMRGAFGKDGQGRDVMYTVVAGAPSVFTIIDIATGTVTSSKPMPDTSGAWSVTTASDGTVYLGAYNFGLLYRYIPATDELINLGYPLPTHDSVLYPMAAGKDGKMYGGTYPTADLYEYDPATNRFTDFGTMSFKSSGERWARVVVYDEETNKIYAGVGNTPRLLEYDLTTGAKRDLLPPEYSDIIAVYDLNLLGGRLFARKEANNPNETFVIDVKTGAQVEVTNGDTGEKSLVFTNFSRGISPKSPIANKFYFAGAGGELFEYDLDTNVYHSLHVTIEGAAIGYGFAQLQEDGFPGYSLVGLSGNEGKLFKYNLENGKMQLIDVQVPAEPVNIHDIMTGPDGKIYTTGYLQGNLGAFTPSSGQSQYFSGLGQGEGMTSIGNSLYFGVYPTAKVYEYDLSKPWNRTNSEKLNPNQLFALTYNPDIPGYTDQDRPFGMAGSEELHKLFVGTVPKNAMLGGAFAVYDLEKRGQPDVHWNIVPDQSIISLVYKDGFVYGGTSIHGGQGSTPTASSAVLFVWDVNKGEKVFEVVPAPGKQAITALHIGPDGNIWGLSNGTLFIFDPVARKVIYSKDEFPDANGRWIDGSFVTGTDGNLYATVGGRFFKIDAATRKVTVLATQARKVAMDDFGRFYLYSNPEGSHLYRYTIPELVLKLTGAELTAVQTELKPEDETSLALTGLLEKQRTTKDLAGAAIQYSVGNPDVIDVQGGQVIAKRYGTSTVTATVTLGGVTVQSNTITVNVQDLTPPVTTAEAGAAKPAVNGWYTSEVTVTLNGIDEESGVASTFYVVDDGAEQIGNVVKLTADGIHTIQYWSTDRAGNVEERHTMTVRLDQTAPVVRVLPSESILWPANHALIPIHADVDAADSVSGIGSIVLTSVSSNEPDNGLGDGDTAGDIQDADLRTADYDFTLRSERSGQGDGRVYTITYTVTDQAGNAAEGVATVTVPHSRTK